MAGVAIAGASLASAGIGAIASSSAASKQAKAANNALNLQESMFNQAKAGLQPYNDFGQSVLPELQGLLGIGPKGGAGMQSTLEQLPGYQFTLGQGLKSTQNSYAARGLGTSGAALKGAAGYATGLANSQYNNYFNNLLGATNIGAGAAGNLAGAATGFANPIGNSATNIGNAQANGILGASNAFGNNIGGIAALFGGGNDATASSMTGGQGLIIGR